MNKRDYIQSISEIKATDSFKQRTILNIQQMEADTHTNPDSLNANFTYKPETVRRKSAIRNLVIIFSASLILVFSTLVYAGVFDLNKIYRIVFGDTYETVQPYIQPISNVGENDVPGEAESIGVDENDILNSVESMFDGIVIRGISAINDENTLHIFATVTDTTQNRVNKDTKFDDWGLDQGHGGNITVVDYDNETKTATLLITSLGEHHAGNATLKINGFTNGRKAYEGINEDDLNLHEVLKRHTPTTVLQEDVWVNGGAFQSKEGESLARQSDILKFDETNIKFDNIDWCSISNIGFVDGHLHIQTKSLSDNQNHLASINFVNSKNEILHNGDLFLSYINLENRSKGYQASYEQYKEMIYEDITSIEQLKDLSITTDYMEEGNVTNGSWEFSFNVPEKATIEVNIFNEPTINGKSAKVNSISLSPLGITMQLHENIATEYNHNDSAYVVYENGAIIDLAQTAIHGYEEQSTLIFSGQAIEIKRVKSIVINDEVINIIPMSSSYEE